MWIVKMVLWVLLTLFLIYFASENANQEVQVQFWQWESQPLALWLVMFFSFAAGVVVWLIGSIFKIIQLKNDIRKLRKENKSISGELDRLRSITIEETPNLNSDQTSGTGDQTLLITD